MNDANGRPLYMRTNYTVEGSPYFDEQYRPADILTADNKVYHEVLIKVNILDRQVQFLDDKGLERVTTVPIKKIRFRSFIQEGKTTAITLSSFSYAINSEDDSIYQLLDSGKMSLVKHLKADYTDEKKYGEAGITRKFKLSEVYYALAATGIKQKLQKNKEVIIEVLNDKKELVEVYIEKNHIRCKSGSDLQQVFHFYNSLF